MTPQMPMTPQSPMTPQEPTTRQKPGPPQQPTIRLLLVHSPLVGPASWDLNDATVDRGQPSTAASPQPQPALSVAALSVADLKRGAT